MQKLIIIGAGGFGREVLWLTREIIRSGAAAIDVVGFLDDNPARRDVTINGVPVLGGTDQVATYASDPNVSFIIGIGEPDIRRAMVARFAAHNPRYATLIHPRALGEWEYIQIGQGSIICAGVILTTNIKLGEHVILNLMVNVGHDASIGSYTTIAPNSTVSGSVAIGEGTYLGSGSVIRDEVTIGEWSIVGMGAVVTKPLPADVVAAGVPAQVIRENKARRVW